MGGAGAVRTRARRVSDQSATMTTDGIARGGEIPTMGDSSNPALLPCTSQGAIAPDAVPIRRIVTTAMRARIERGISSAEPERRGEESAMCRSSIVRADRERIRGTLAQAIAPAEGVRMTNAETMTAPVRSRIERAMGSMGEVPSGTTRARPGRNRLPSTARDGGVIGVTRGAGATSAKDPIAASTRARMRRRFLRMRIRIAEPGKSGPVRRRFSIVRRRRSNARPSRCDLPIAPRTAAGQNRSRLLARSDPSLRRS